MTTKAEPVSISRVVSGKMVPIETAREAVRKSYPDADIGAWLTSFNSILLCAVETTADPVRALDVYSVLAGLIYAIQSYAGDCYEQALKMLEEVQS